MQKNLVLKSILIGKFRTVTSAAVVIALAGLASRFLGLIRDHILSGKFGAGAELDVYYAAFRVPDVVYNLIIVGAIAAGFIPVFTSYIKKEDDASFKDNKAAWEVSNNVMTVFSVALIAICGLLYVIAPYIIPLVTPGFSGSQLELTITLSRIMFLSPVLLGISGILGAMLQSFNRFVMFSLAPIIYNVGIIIGALYLEPFMGLAGLAWGVVLGAALHLLIQLPAVWQLGWRPQLLWRLKDQAMRKIVGLMGPRIMGLAITQINMVVVTALGSFLVMGSIAMYNLAINLQTVPVGLVGIAFAIAAFPSLSKSFADNKHTDFANTFRNTFRMILFAMVPLTVIFLVVRIQMVRVIFGSGAFNWDDTIMTANVLGLMAISLVPQALIPLFVRAFFARHNTKIPLWAAVISSIIQVILSWWWIHTPLGVYGLALAFSVSCIVNALVLAVLLRSAVPAVSESTIWLSFLKAVVAGFVQGIVTQLLKTPIASIVDMQTRLGIFLQGFGAAIGGLVAFALVCHLLRCTEYIMFKDGLTGRLFKSVRVKDEGIAPVAGE